MMGNPMKFVHSAMLVSMLLAWPAPMPGQAAAMAGCVTGRKQTPVAAAIVTITETDSGWKRTVLSDLRGCFSLSPLPPGSYRAEVLKPGFKPFRRAAIRLKAGESQALELRLFTDDTAEMATDSLECAARYPGAAPDVGCNPRLFTVVDLPAFWP
jgi:hypothetical protein